MIDFTPLPSNPGDLPIGIGRLLLTGDPVRAVTLIIRENNRRANEAKSNTAETPDMKEAV